MALVLLMGTTEAWAHSFNCAASVEGDVVRVYSWFGGRRATYPDNAPVRVETPDGTLLHEGRTDANGEYAFPLTVRVELRITVDGGTGHVAQTTVPESDLPASLPEWVPGMSLEDVAAGGAESVAEETSQEAADAGARGLSGVDGAELERMVRVAVQEEIRPIRRELQVYREARGLQDLLGGIGYILGITGLAFYVLALRRRSPVGVGTSHAGGMPAASSADPTGVPSASTSPCRPETGADAHDHHSKGSA